MLDNKLYLVCIHVLTFQTTVTCNHGDNISYQLPITLSVRCHADKQLICHALPATDLKTNQYMCEGIVSS